MEPPAHSATGKPDPPDPREPPPTEGRSRPLRLHAADGRQSRSRGARGFLHQACVAVIAVSALLLTSSYGLGTGPIAASPTVEAATWFADVRPPKELSSAAGLVPAASQQNGSYRDYRVKRGDTLWAIAAAELGDPFRWPEIAAASAGITQPDGDTLTDPNLIRTGWILQIPGAALTSVTAGGGYTCALDGSGLAWCWGSDWAGTLGDGGTTGDGGNRASPVTVADGHTFTSISAGYTHACAIDDSRRGWCWGWEEAGALGDGGPSDEATEASPVLVTGGQALTAISSGWSGSCALDPTGRAWCWGTGRGTSPVAVVGDRTYKAISDGDYTCALDTTGSPWCWDFDLEPVEVAGGHTFTAISAGGATCALDTSGAAWCWDVANDGLDIPENELGTPAAVPGNHVFTQISSGAGYHACALDPDGRAWCWGSNRDGQLGNGHAAEGRTSAPVAVSGGHQFTAISAGEAHTCALDRSGAAWCWGEGQAFGTGSQSTPNYEHPVRIHSKPEVREEPEVVEEPEAVEGTQGGRYPTQPCEKLLAGLGLLRDLDENILKTEIPPQYVRCVEEHRQDGVDYGTPCDEAIWEFDPFDENAGETEYPPDYVRCVAEYAKSTD